MGIFGLNMAHFSLNPLNSTVCSRRLSENFTLIINPRMKVLRCCLRIDVCTIKVLKN